MDIKKWNAPIDENIENQNREALYKKRNEYVNKYGDVLDEDNYRKVRKEIFANSDLSSAVNPRDLVEIINRRQENKNLPYNKDLADTLFPNDNFISDERFRRLSNEDKRKVLNRLYDAERSKEYLKDGYNNWDELVSDILDFRSTYRDRNRPNNRILGSTELDLADLLESIINGRNE